MIERREHLSFAREASQTVGIVRKRIRQHLDRDIPIELRVGRAVHRAHAPFAELRNGPVMSDRFLRNHPIWFARMQSLSDNYTSFSDTLLKARCTEVPFLEIAESACGRITRRPGVGRI